MLERLADEIPRFFTPQNLLYLLEAIGTTQLMTIIGCGLGFQLAFGIVFLRQTPGWLALPIRLAAILYVEIFRRIPFLVVIYLVLFVIQAIVSNASLFVIAVIAIIAAFLGFDPGQVLNTVETVQEQRAPQHVLARVRRHARGRHRPLRAALHAAARRRVAQPATL